MRRMQRIEREREDDEGNCREKEMEIEREREKKARQRETGNPLTPPSEFLPGSRSRSRCVTAREREREAREENEWESGRNRETGSPSLLYLMQLSFSLSLSFSISWISLNEKGRERLTQTESCPGVETLPVESFVSLSFFHSVFSHYLPCIEFSLSLSLFPFFFLYPSLFIPYPSLFIPLSHALFIFFTRYLSSHRENLFPLFPFNSFSFLSWQFSLTVSSSLRISFLFFLSPSFLSGINSNCIRFVCAGIREFFDLLFLSSLSLSLSLTHILQLSIPFSHFLPFSHSFSYFSLFLSSNSFLFHFSPSWTCARVFTDSLTNKT